MDVGGVCVYVNVYRVCSGEMIRKTKSSYKGNRLKKDLDQPKEDNYSDKQIVTENNNALTQSG